MKGEKQEASSGKGRVPYGGTRDKSKIKCFKCRILGHYAKECRKPQKEREVVANLTNVQEDEPTLLMAQICNTTEAVDSTTAQVVLNEVHAQAYLGCEEGHQDDKWYLNTGTSNHGYKENFAKLIPP